MNTNGASKGDVGYAGGGGVLRDCRGSFIRAFSTIFGCCSAYRAEITSATIGLEMAKAMGISKLELQMDNKACVEVIQISSHHGGECVHLLTACRALILSDGWEVRLSHCYREGNKVTDRLANIGIL